ncbi:MAG: hypothetical protein O7A09_06750, partial [Proteobacteria bacterium]|nr:hypothetical protein [Pseudomonadota bacterium]
PAALGFSALVAWSFAWVLFAQQLLTEVTSVALLCGFLLAVRPALRSVPGAIGLGGLTLVAYLTRGNLMVLLPAVLLAVIVDRGPRAALRSVPLWAYAGSALVLERAVALAVSAVQGIPLYEHYGVMAEILSGPDAARFQTEYVGSTAFLKIHWREVLALLGDNALRTYRLVFVDSVYHHAGWFALPAVVWGLVRGGPSSLERRLLAFAVMGFTASGVLGYGGYDPLRYPLPAVVCVWLLAMGMLADAGEWLDRRGGTEAPRRWAHWLPLGVAGLLLLEGAPTTLSWTAQTWTSYREHGTIRQGLINSGRAEDEWSRVARRFCPKIDPNALAAAHDPWTLYVFCGNAGYWLPPELDTPEWVDRYLDERAPSFIVVDGSDEYTALVRSPRLREIAREGRYVLYELSGSPGRGAPWSAPPPLASLGGPAP